MRETYPCWSGFICTAWPVTRGEMALQAGVQLSPTEHWPRQRNARRLGLKTAQHSADNKGRFCNALGVEGPLWFWWARTWAPSGFQAPVTLTPHRVSVKSSADVGTTTWDECAWPRIAGFDGMVKNKKLRRLQHPGVTEGSGQSHSIVSSRLSTGS